MLLYVIMLVVPSVLLPKAGFVQSVKKVEVQEALLPLNRRGGLLP